MNRKMQIKKMHKKIKQSDQKIFVEKHCDGKI